MTSFDSFSLFLIYFNTPYISSSYDNLSSRSSTFFLFLISCIVNLFSPFLELPFLGDAYLAYDLLPFRIDFNSVGFCCCAWVLLTLARPGVLDSFYLISFWSNNFTCFLSLNIFLWVGLPYWLLERFDTVLNDFWVLVSIVVCLSLASNISIFASSLNPLRLVP